VGLLIHHHFPFHLIWPTKEMTFALLFAAALSEYIELNPENVDRVVGGPRAVFLKFYAVNCSMCAQMAYSFSDSAVQFPEITFGGIECLRHSRLCESFRVDSWPTLYFFPANDKTWTEYEGGRSQKLFADFLGNHTALRARPSRVRNLVDLTPATLPTAAAPGHCALVFFHGKACPECFHLRPYMGLLSFVYEGDPNVTIGMFDCSRYNAICKARFPGVRSAQRADAFQIYAYGRWANFSDERQLSALVPRINRVCGVSRRTDGLLGDAVGRIPAADAIAQRFVTAENKEELIAEMRGVPGADLYVTVMKRFMDGDVTRIKDEIHSMRDRLRQRKGSMSAMDNMKRSANVFHAFVPAKTPEPATPTPPPVAPSETL
jgi:hypothetical protein